MTMWGAGALCREVLSLPMHPDMEKEQTDFIISGILNFFDQHK